MKNPDERIEQNQLARIEQLEAERDSFYMEYRIKCDEQTKALHIERDELKADATRLDYIEQLAKSSHSGVTIDYAKYVEDGRVLERGYRINWFHHLGDREKTLRKAIDAAIAKGEK